jgi:tetratricopeptide (TPR) repeat protein
MRVLTRFLAVWLAAIVPSTGTTGQQPPARPDLEAIAAAPSPPMAVSTARRGSELDRALQARDWDRAERLLVEQIERTPDSPELLKTLAGVFLMDRKPLNAAIALKKAEALAPLDRESRFRLVLAYIAMKRGDWARPELERLAQAEGANTLYQYWLGRLDYDDGQYESAIRRLSDVVARDPGFVRAFDNLGLCHEALHQPEQAVVRYREAIRLNRQAAAKSAWPPLNLAILLRARGELAEAEGLLREALTYDEAFAIAHYQLGALLEQTGRLEEALTVLGRAVAADEAYAAPHYARARIYRQQGRASEADAALVAFKRLSARTHAGRP